MRSRAANASVAVLLALAALALMPRALAQPAAPPAAGPSKAEREAARAEAVKGFEQLKRGAYAEAIISFKKAEAVYHATPHLVYLARAHVGLGRLIAARDLYDRVIAEQLASYAPDAFRQAQADAAQERAELLARIPTVEVVVSGVPAGQATVSVDGADVPAAEAAQPIAVDPGEHLVSARVEGAPASKKITVAQGDRLRVELAVTPPVHAPSSALPLPNAAPPPAPGSGPQPPAVPGSGAPTAGAAAAGPSPRTPSLGREPAAGSRERARRPWLAPAAVAFSLGGIGLVAGVVTGGLSIEAVAELEARCPDFHCPAAEQATADRAKALGTASTIAIVVAGAALTTGIVLVAVRPGAPAVRVALGGASLEGRF